MNWLIAFLIFTILAWVGMPEFLDNQFSVKEDIRVVTEPIEVAEVAENSPAEQAGMLAGDKILSVDGNEFYHAYEITDYNETHAGETVTYEIEREGTVGPCGCPECDWVEDCTTETKRVELKVTLNEAGSEYLLGITMITTQSLSYSYRRY